MEYNIGTKVFRDWKIIREIGEGSYGKVYELEKANYGVTAKSALKMIRIPKSASEIRDALSEGMDEQSVTAYFEGIVEQFVREIAVMSELKSHPNIVACEDYIVESHEGQAIGWDILIRMELLTGLQEYQLSHPLDETAVRQLAEDICEALVFCQQKNLIHRDIKPGNIFVDSMGRFKLGDFGVARTAERTMGGLSKQGTENYMAPEVYFGRPYGGSVDVYSLGLVLYRLMNCNRLPFYPLPPQPIRLSDRENALNQRLQGAPIPAPCNASEEFAAIIQKACAADPRQRYHTAAEMLADLRRQPVAVPVMVHTGEVVQADTVEDEGTCGVFGAAPAPYHEAEDDGTVSVFGASAASAEQEVLRDEDDGTMNVFSVTAATDGDHTERVRRAVRTEEKTEESVPAQKRKKKLLWIPLVALAVVIVVLIFLLRGCSDTNGPDNPGSSSSETPLLVLVPDVKGRTVDEARQMLNEVGLEAELTYKISDTQPEGIVLDMGVNANTEVEKGSVILLTVSSGKAVIEVPDVLDKTKEDAEAALKNAGFQVTVQEDYSSTVAAGLIMAQSPESGRTLPEGGTVTITVSLGKKPVTVPNVSGQDRETAVEALEALGLIVDVTEVYNDTVAAGKVISQTPTGETAAFEGDTVQLVVSAGTQTTTVPAVTGNSQSAATSKLQNAGFKVTVKEEYSNTAAVGTVIRQSPSANGTAAVGGTVTIVVSKGKQPVAIPSVVGSSKSTATSKLQNAGFKVTVQEEYSATVAAGTVIRQSPAANTTAAAGSAVTIVVSKGKRPVDIPDVTGKTKDSAVSALQSAGFKVSVKEEYSDKVGAGKVTRQSPANGTGYAGDTITIYISKGVEVIVPTGVALNKTSATLLIGGTVQLSATVTPSNASNTAVSWVSGNPAVATVSDNGLVTAKAPGTTTITVKTASGSKSTTCAITVTAPTMNSFSNLTLNVDQGSSYMPITISNAGTASFSYEVTSSNTSAVNVNRAGSQFILYGRRPGSATITVKATTGSYTITKTFTVTVNTPQITLSSTSGTTTTNQLYTISSTFRGFKINLPQVYTSGVNMDQTVGGGWELVSGPGKVIWSNSKQEAYYGSTSTSFSGSGTAVFRYYVKTQSGDIYYSPNFSAKVSVYKTTTASNKLRKTAGSDSYYTLIPANKTVYFTEFKISGSSMYGKTTYGGYTGWVIIANL